MLLKSVCTCTCQRLAWTASLCPCRDVAVHIPCGQWSVLILLSLILSIFVLLQKMLATRAHVFSWIQLFHSCHMCASTVSLLAEDDCLHFSVWCIVILLITYTPFPHQVHILLLIWVFVYLYTHTHIYKYLSLCVVYYSLWSKTLIILCFLKGMH